MGRILRRPPSTGLKRNCCGNAVFRSSAFIKSGETSEKWDWDYYFECVKRVNESTRHRMEWLERNIPDFTAGRYWGKLYLQICGIQTRQGRAADCRKAKE